MSERLLKKPHDVGIVTIQQTAAGSLLSPAFGGCLFLFFLAPEWDQQAGQSRSHRDPEIQEEGLVPSKQKELSSI